MNLRVVNVDRSLFRQLHQKLTTAFGQVGGVHEEIVHRLVKEIDLGKRLEKDVTGPREEFGDMFNKVVGDAWNLLIDKAEAEAYDKIQFVLK